MKVDYCQEIWNDVAVNYLRTSNKNNQNAPNSSIHKVYLSIKDLTLQKEAGFLKIYVTSTK